MMEISQEELDQFKKDLKIAKFQLQELNDTIEGGIRSSNIKEFRNTYVINAQDSLDASYPMYVHFNIISEMIKIVSVKVSFWILNYRAYSTAAASGGVVTSASGGGETPTSSSGGAVTSAANTSWTNMNIATGTWQTATNVGDEGRSGYISTGYSVLSIVTPSHTHIGGSHTHTVTITAHTHIGGAHAHNITYGIFEEDTSPTIKFYVSENEGVSYSDVYGGYDVDKSAIDITSLITTTGSKLIKFESTVRARLSIQVTIKLDIKAR